MRVRTGRPEETSAIRAVLDGGLLELEDGQLDRAVRRDDALVAVRAGRDDDIVLGAAVLDGSQILAIAVRRRRRDQGIGTALVRQAATSRDVIEAEFDERVRPFWESVGFEIEPAPDGRFRGRLSGR